MVIISGKSQWYIVSVHSGLEKKVLEVIKEQAAKIGLIGHFEEFWVPSETIVEMKRGSKVNVEKNYFPGYIIIKAIMTDAIWSMINNIPRVTGFLGPKGKPLPVREEEIKKIMRNVLESKEKPRSNIRYEIGELIKVSDGPFTSFSGNIESLDEEKEKLVVLVSVFGRPTPIELSFEQIEKS